MAKAEAPSPDQEAAELAEIEANTDQTSGRLSPEYLLRRQQDRDQRNLRKAISNERGEQRAAARPAPRPSIKKQIGFDRIAKTHTVSTDWTITCPDAVPVEDWLDGERLKSLARVAHVGDRVTMRNEALTLIGDAIVVLAEAAADKLILRWVHEPIALQPVDYEDLVMGNLAATYLGVHRQWGVLRVSDSHVVLDGLPSKREAIHRITNDLAPRPVA